jgi:diguanylate cyclase (GGDEF)-like protein
MPSGRKTAVGGADTAAGRAKSAAGRAKTAAGPAAAADLEARLALLQGLEVFGGLSPDELTLVARQSGFRSFRKGEAVFTAGKGPGRLYVIREGEVLISRSGPDGRQIGLATFVSGESFGELSLFEPQQGDSTATCERDSVLLLFPAGRSRARRIFSRYPHLGAKTLHNLLAIVARRIRSTNQLIAEKTPWVQDLKKQAMVDKLTGLYSAAFLEEELPALLETCRGRLGLLMIKPDHLKPINDTYGHAAGDRTLQLMAAALRGVLAEGDAAVRYRGDVLAAVLPRRGLKAALALAEQLRQRMADLDLGEISRGRGPAVRITVSVGVCMGSREAEAAPALVERAYENLFIARNSGGDRVHGR